MRIANPTSMTTAKPPKKPIFSRKTTVTDLPMSSPCLCDHAAMSTDPAVPAVGAQSFAKVTEKTSGTMCRYFTSSSTQRNTAL